MERDDGISTFQFRQQDITLKYFIFNGTGSALILFISGLSFFLKINTTIDLKISIAQEPFKTPLSLSIYIFQYLLLIYMLYLESLSVKIWLNILQRSEK